MCSGKRAEDSLYQNVMGDDRPLFNEFSFHSKAIPVTPADAVLTKANLLLHTKVVDSSPATSLCHIPVGAGGFKIFLSANSGAGAIEQRPRQGKGGPTGEATKFDAATENEPGAEAYGSVFKCHTNAPEPEPTPHLRTEHSFTRSMTLVSDSAQGNLMHSNSWNSNQATPQNASRSYRNFMSTSPNPPPEGGGAAFLAEVLNSCASGSGKKDGLQQDLDMELVAALAAETCLPARHAGCDSSETEPESARYLDDKKDHLSLENNELGGSDELGGSVETSADDDGVMIESLIDGAAEKNKDIELVEALAANAGSPKGSKDRGARRRHVLGICWTQGTLFEDEVVEPWHQALMAAGRSGTRVDNAQLASQTKIPAQQQEQKLADSSESDDMETQEAELLLSTALRAEASACSTSNSAKVEQHMSAFSTTNSVRKEPGGHKDIPTKGRLGSHEGEEREEGQCAGDEYLRQLEEDVFEEEEGGEGAQSSVSSVVSRTHNERLAQGDHSQVFMGMRFYIQEGSAASDIMDEAKDALLLHGGVIAESVNHATHILVDTIADPALLKGSQNNLPTPAIRTSKWVLECCRMRTTVWPSGEFEWKCWDFLAQPQHGIPPVEGVNTFVITLTGYTGLHREILKRLIEKSGAQCTSALTRANTHLLCHTATSKKAIAAKNWGVKVVNHLWIMDSMLTWTWQPCNNYTRSGQDIMTEGGIWTLLDEATLKSGTVLPHPRLGVWPFPKDVNALDESEIAGRQSRPKSPVVSQQRTTLQPLSVSEQGSIGGRVVDGRQGETYESAGEDRGGRVDERGGRGDRGGKGGQGDGGIRSGGTGGGGEIGGGGGSGQGEGIGDQRGRGDENEGGRDGGGKQIAGRGGDGGEKVEDEERAENSGQDGRTIDSVSSSGQARGIEMSFSVGPTTSSVVGVQHAPISAQNVRSAILNQAPKIFGPEESKQICNEALKPFFREDKRQEAKRDDKYKDERTKECIAKWEKLHEGFDNIEEWLEEFKRALEERELGLSKYEVRVHTRRSYHKILVTWIKDRLINGTLGEGIECKLLGYVKRAVLHSEPGKVQNLFPDPDEEVTSVIAAAKMEKELFETRKEEETTRTASGAVASAPSSSAASASSASSSDLQPRLQAQEELPKTLNAAAGKSRKRKSKDEDAGQGGGGQAQGGKRQKQSGDNGRPIVTENRTRPRTTWGIDKDSILMNAYQAFGSKFYERPEMKKSLPGHTPDSLRHRYMRIRSDWMGDPRPSESEGGSRYGGAAGTGEGGGNKDMQGQGPGRPNMQMEDVGKSTGNEDKDRGGDKEREEQKIPCQYDCGKTFDLKKKTGKANKARHEKECGKRAAEDYSGSKVDRSTRNDKKDRGGDQEREVAEDMSEFETRCWECKFGACKQSHYSRRQCREVHGHTGPDWRRDPSERELGGGSRYGGATGAGEGGGGVASGKAGKRKEEAVRSGPREHQSDAGPSTSSGRVIVQHTSAAAAGQRIPDSDDEEDVHASGRDDGGARQTQAAAAAGLRLVLS